MENREFVGVDAWGFGGKCWRICIRPSRLAKVIGTQSFRPKLLDGSATEGHFSVDRIDKETFCGTCPDNSICKK